MTRVDKIKEWLRAHPFIEAALWFIAVLMCIALLVWFYACSGFGDPPEFVYEQF